MLTHPPANPRLAAALREAEEEIMAGLLSLEWADPADPTRLIQDPEQVRPRVRLFFESFVAGIGEDDWATFDERIAGPTAELLRRGVVSAAKLTQRASTVCEVFIPVVARQSDPAPLLNSMFSALQVISNQLVIAYSDHLLEASRRLSDLKSLFLHLGSHELRGPLTITRGYASLLTEDEGAVDVAVAAEAIVTASDTAITLLDDLVEVGRLSDDGSVLNLTSASLREIAGRARERVERDAGARGIAIEINADDADVTVDSDRCVIAVRNLLSNAVKHGPSDSVVRLTAAAVPDGALITVHDDGPAIPADVREKLFERFYRADATRAAGVPGSGLGLYIVERIAHLHGGTVRATVGTESGNDFVLTLPAVTTAS